MIELRFEPEDLVRLRFALSPLWETRAAVGALHRPDRHGHHLPWLRTVGRTGLDVSAVRALMPRHGYTPDFLSPPPDGPLADIGDELRRVRATAPERVAIELGWVAEDVPDPAPVHRLLADPAGARDLLADQLEAAWTRLVEPYWPRLRDLLDADIAYRARQFAAGGTEQVLAGLHRQVSWVPGSGGGSVRVTGKVPMRRDLGGDGLLLMPSAFGGPDVLVILDAPWQPTLTYPARGVGTLWEPAPSAPPEALARLVGRTRARLLLAVAEPATTTALARRFGLSAGTVSEHLTALRAGGLVSARRHGRSVRYERSSAGDLLVYVQAAGVRPG